MLENAAKNNQTLIWGHKLKKQEKSPNNLITKVIAQLS